MAEILRPEDIEGIDDIEDALATGQESIEESAEKVKDAAEAVREAAEQLKAERAEFEKEREEFEQQRTASPPTAIANSVGGGENSDRDFASAIKNGGASADGGSNPVSEKSAAATYGSDMGAVRVAKIHTGEVEPRNAQERRLASLEGEEKRKAMAMVAKELPDENGDRGFMRAIKQASAE